MSDHYWIIAQSAPLRKQAIHQGDKPPDMLKCVSKWCRSLSLMAELQLERESCQIVLLTLLKAPF
jgi:hypothetical protein